MAIDKDRLIECLITTNKRLWQQLIEADTISKLGRKPSEHIVVVKGKTLRAMRKAAGLSPQQLSERLDCRHSLIIHKETRYEFSITIESLIEYIEAIFKDYLDERLPNKDTAKQRTAKQNLIRPAGIRGGGSKRLKS